MYDEGFLLDQDFSTYVWDYDEKQTQKVMILNIMREQELVCFCEELVREYWFHSRDDYFDLQTLGFCLQSLLPFIRMRDFLST